MVEIRQCLPDDIRLGQRCMRNRNRQIINLQLPVFAEVPGQRAGRAGTGHIVPVAFAGGGILMAGTGKMKISSWHGHTETIPVPPTTTSRRVSSMMPVRNALTMVCRES